MGKQENGKEKIGWFNGRYEWLPGTFVINGKDYLLTKENVWLIPCGKCIGCNLARSRDWANRCMLELKYHDQAYFVTLTYDEDHVPRNIIPVDDYEDTGQVVEHQTLYYRDFQLFMKRLRKAFPNDKIRYFMAGEYGTKTFRPHYHAIIYGLHLDDLVLKAKSPLGDSYFISQKLESVWQNGFVLVGDVTWETCAYTARYCMKKADGRDKSFYEKLGIEPEFVHMSTRGGIARKYYDETPDLFDYSYINLSGESGAKKFPPPKYFVRLLEADNPEKAQELKKVRKEAAFGQLEQKLFSTDLFLDELLQIEENAKASRIKSLRRDIV